ncbi:MAG: PilZ domain-containing protein [Vicinamibacterales bacterium]
MLQRNSMVVTPPVRPQGSGADRRAHPRLRSAKLGITRVNIRNRQSASLVDLSSGGALLELPFQVSPESRVAMQLDAAGGKFEVPFQLLRCYVADLRSSSVKYHAAGAFDNLLNLEALAMQASPAMPRLMISLERLERGMRKTAAQSRSDAQFHETLTDLISWLRRSESLDLAVLKLKARLTQTYRSLLIIPSTSPTFDRATSLECFGLTFKAKHPLSAHDRRFLKANAQLISILEGTRRELRDHDARPRSPQVLHSTADWLASQSELLPAQPLPRRAPISQPVAKAPARTPIAEGDETDYFAALMLDPAFA